MAVRHSARWRQLSWASYGNAYLKASASLPLWRPGAWETGELFQRITDEFRLPDGELVAKDGFEWLWWLKQGGARRLSLEMQDGFGGVGRYADPERQVIVCHYPDRDEIWASMTETSMAQAQASPSGNDELAFERDFHYPERFVRIATRPPAPRAARADWRKIRRQIENRLLEFGGMAALFERSGSGEAPDWLITLPPLEDGCWLSRGNADSLPTLPPTPALRIVHELLHGLMTLRSRFNNAIHIKNEGNLYLWATPEESARLSELADTINQGIERLQCQAGSETRWRWPFDEGAAPGLTPLADHPGSPEKPVGIGSLLLALLLLCLTLTAVWHFPKTALFSILLLATYRLIRRG